MDTTMINSRFSSLFIILFLSVLLMSHSIEGGLDDVCPSENGIKIFDSSREICCEGTTHNKHKYLCCNKKLEDKYVCSLDSRHCEEQICCESKLVSKRKSLCCNNTLNELTDSQVNRRNDLRCCGNESYNISEGDLKTCCGGTLISVNPRIGCCHGVIYDKVKTKKRCVARKLVLPFEGVCNGDIYDKMSSSCCGVKLNTKVPELLRNQDGAIPNPAFDCCGGEVMDPQKEKCCPENIHRFPSHAIPKDANIQCCGKGHFDMSKQFCINDTAVLKGQYGEQCGSHLIDWRRQSCCDNKLPYDNETQACCKGSHHCILPKDGACCNGYPLRENEMCCQGFRPCKKGKKNDDKCCYNLLTGRGRTYNSNNNQKCHRGKLVNRSVGRSPCGPSKFYSVFHEICCSHNIYKRKEGYVGCCGDKGLKQNEECCEKLEKRRIFGNEVQKRILTPCVKARCGFYSINTATKRCCGNRFPYLVSSKRKDCCADRELYDKKYSKCSEGGRVEPLKPRSGFCRSRTFDGAIEEACVRKYGIVGKVTRFKAQTANNFTIVTMYLRNVRPIERETVHPAFKPPRKLVLLIQTKLRRKKLCLRYFEKKWRKFIMFFDEPIRGNQVQIFKRAPFFVTKYTRRRYKDVKRGMTKEFCSQYQKFNS